jgi:hypothetical protein
VNAVYERYRFITLRDLNPRNRDKRIYRGPARSLVNWQRLKSFAGKEGIELGEFRQEVADALRSFLERELDDVSSGRRGSSINCSLDDLLDFAGDVGLDISDMTSRLEELCGG